MTAIIPQKIDLIIFHDFFREIWFRAFFIKIRKILKYSEKEINDFVNKNSGESVDLTTKNEPQTLAQMAETLEIRCPKILDIGIIICYSFL